MLPLLIPPSASVAAYPRLSHSSLVASPAPFPSISISISISISRSRSRSRSSLLPYHPFPNVACLPPPLAMSLLLPPSRFPLLDPSSPPFDDPPLPPLSHPRRPPRLRTSALRFHLFSPHDDPPSHPPRLSVPNLSLGSAHAAPSPPSAVAIAARPAFDEEEIDPWRLEAQLTELKALRDALARAATLEHKLEILGHHPRVRAVFGHIDKIGVLLNPVVTLAMETLGDYEMYLLKCMVAGGQDHLLQVSSGWLRHLDKCATSSNDSDSHAHREGARSMPQLHLTSKENGSSTGHRSNHGQSHDRMCMNRMLQQLNKVLHDMESFYDSIGGILGYQITALELIRQAEDEQTMIPPKEMGKKGMSTTFHVPKGLDLSKDTGYAMQAAAWGIQSMPEMGEIYPLGGAGDRLGLVDEVTGECLPVAMLPYCGRTLLEGLIRDLQAREYLYYKLYGKQIISPIAIMTSAAKRNNDLVTKLCENHDWFGRGKSSFFLFEQPLIPAVGAKDGCWLISEPLGPILKPGGHGVIWKLAFDKGVFDWFYSKGRKSAIIRQISNPIAATDQTLLALAGIGCKLDKKFGFASCERKVGAAEGVNVLVEKNKDHRWEYSVTCIEYTEFNKLGIPDVPVSPGSMQAQYPANTNVLFVQLSSVEKIAASQNSDSLPGMILNLKKPVVYKDYKGVTHSTYAGRIECTMQNIADMLTNTFSSRLTPAHQDCLDTFLIYNQRRKVTSSAKRQRKATDISLHQTPDGSFYDITWNAHELLTLCLVDMPEMKTIECYIESGPSFIALLHPAVGPLWSIIRQKIHGGSISEGSELQLEIAEIIWQNVQVEGSLLILAENVMGSFREHKDGDKILHYGDRCGRCRLHNVFISNKGIDWSSNDNVYWQHKVHRLESVKIILRGNSEFEAHDVILRGSHTFDVPDGYRMVVTNTDGGLSCVLNPLAKRTWQWRYTMQDDGDVKLTMEVEN